MKTSKTLLGLFLLLVFVISCQKEKSFEKGFVAASAGSLQSGTTGDCLGSLVSGVYKKDTALNSTNYVDIKIDVTKTGSYLVSSDTINGFFFRATGTFDSIGVNTVRLPANGKPIAAGTNIFTVTYDSTECTFSIPTLDGSTGGTSIFTLAGAPAACTGATVQGILSAGVAANSTNTATIQVNVATAGTYSISTTAVNGVTFSASGTFSATGSQSVTLSANGSPTAAGSFSIPLTAGSSNCSFQITVVGSSPAVYTMNGDPGNCTGATIQGQYVVGTALTTSNTATIQVNVTTAGTYSITTSAVDGITFTGSGSFSSTGLQAVVLIANGTPTATGTFGIPVTVGSSTCSFSVTVSPVDYYPRTTNSNWSYNFNNDPTDTLYRNVVAPTLSAIGNTYNIFTETANASAGFDSSGYFRRNGGSYYQYMDFGAFFGFDNPVWGEYIFLKDDQPVNNFWYSDPYTGTSGGSSYTFRAKDSISQKDVPITVNGVTYPNTIVVYEKYEYDPGGGNWTDITSLVGHYIAYFSRNVGMIRLEFYDETGALSGSQDITRAQIF
ncbi:MAG TPA: hypothetical protein VK588_07430 [Chitinophagaceae bacterium]|nr:hypothetical protein [Chitinophagaceae bacterium]